MNYPTVKDSWDFPIWLEIIIYAVIVFCACFIGGIGFAVGLRILGVL